MSELDDLKARYRTKLVAALADIDRQVADAESLVADAADDEERARAQRLLDSRRQTRADVERKIENLNNE